MVQIEKSLYSWECTQTEQSINAGIFNKTSKMAITITLTENFECLIPKNFLYYSFYQTLKSGRYVNRHELAKFCHKYLAALPYNSMNVLIIRKILRFIECTEKDDLGHSEPSTLFFMATSEHSVPYWIYLAKPQIDKSLRERLIKQYGSKVGNGNQPDHSILQYSLEDWNDISYPLPMEYFFV